jgi:flagellar biogenesis protein FliO
MDNEIIMQKFKNMKFHKENFLYRYDYLLFLLLFFIILIFLFNIWLVNGFEPNQLLNLITDVTPQINKSG